ncbi:MAG: hypothetical protein ACE5I1_19645 [bacterium]
MLASEGTRTALCGGMVLMIVGGSVSRGPPVGEIWRAQENRARQLMVSSVFIHVL